MTELVAILIGSVAGVLLWSAFLNAPVLMWRARMTRNWNIGFRDAYVVSIKAGLGATVLASIATFVSALVVGLSFGEVGGVGEKGLVALGSLLGVVTWFFLHANALLAAASSTHMLNVLDARSLSWNVLGWIAAAVGVLYIGLMLALGVIYLVTG